MEKTRHYRLYLDNGRSVDLSREEEDDKSIIGLFIWARKSFHSNVFGDFREGSFDLSKVLGIVQINSEGQLTEQDSYRQYRAARQGGGAGLALDETNNPEDDEYCDYVQSPAYLGEVDNSDMKIKDYKLKQQLEKKQRSDDLDDYLPDLNRIRIGDIRG